MGAALRLPVLSIQITSCLIMSPNEKLVEVIKSLRNDPECTDLLKDLLDEGRIVSEIAVAIQEGRKRSDFVQIIPAELYWDFCQLIRGNRIDGGTVTRRIGQYGGLFLKPDAVRNEQIDLPKEQELEAVEAQQEAADKNERAKEKFYYPLVKQWAIDNGFAGCEIVGGALPRYRWENPDLICLDYDVHKNHKIVELSCISFEVKLNIDPYAVWQAAHYHRFSNQVYLAIAKSEQEIADRYEGRALDLAIEFGLGVLCFEKETKQFRMMQRPKTIKPSHEEIELVFESYPRIAGPILDRMREAYSDLYRFRFS